MSAVTTEASLWDDNWAARAVCRTGSPDELFAKGAAQQTAKVICQRCPVVAECLADALDNKTEYGVWGGMTERERRALLRRRPDVKSWAQLFKAARADERNHVGAHVTGLS
ncbi:WhiB family transcriptional regulator [Leekyejoonella antrihumi]|uniref:Transcriptional regulator WhiB n=1 Tax=Leekyejoonella antrihumi TaxID=1660198 RepID=A0A563DWI8_9MICO|nr:WhiB family transcriptional regulator [Leekyejoonella antrihumi]TWP34331.1 WhiB family transcriptional regulator [Leekyejoonella antrihumi]